MNQAPRSVRIHIALFGRRNAGKSSLLNALAGQSVSIVSEVAGTTTDPVEKSMELHGLGPVVLIDTAGLDDAGSLGSLRTQRTRQVFERTDLALLVVGAGDWGPHEQEALASIREHAVPCIVVFNKIDLGEPDEGLARRLRQGCVRVVRTCAVTGEGLDELRRTIIHVAPAGVDDSDSTRVLSDLVKPGELAVLVVPVDSEAPKGRLILPQAQSIRDLLDNDALCMVVKERELRSALDRLTSPPKIVVTDSQAFAQVAADTPKGVLLTSFSILFARLKGDLVTQVRGAAAIADLRPGDRVLMAEACSHHPNEDDIGRVKLPRWLMERVGGELAFDHVQGRDFPDDLSDYRLVVHCGACMWNRRQMLHRIDRCLRADVPVTNYGLAIAYCMGILERALEPFPGALEAYRRTHQAWPTWAGREPDPGQPKGEAVL